MKERVLTATTLLLTCLAAAFASADSANVPDTKPPWEWTSAERAHVRRDLAKRLERVRAYQDERRAVGIASARTPASADVIDGDRNPELFFTTELFETLVRSSFVTLPTAFPEVIRQRTTDLFSNRAEWDRFATIVAEYAAALKEEKAAAMALNKTQVSAMQSRKCAAAARALREARRTFGKVRFDRMLYETIPPGMRTVFSIDTDFETSVGKALEREERCQ